MNINFLHDPFCRGTLCEIPRFLELLEYLASRDPELATIFNLLDKDSFVRIPGDFSNTEIYGYADLAFMAKVKRTVAGAADVSAQVCIGFMAEHKSAPDDGVVEQLRKYNHHLMVQHLKNNVVEGVPSVAVILYNGVQAWDPLEELLEKYPPELRQMVLPFKCVMLNVDDVSDETCLVSMGSELGAIVATMKYVRNPAQKHELFRKILIRLKGDKFTQRTLDLVRQMDVYCNGWLSSEFKEILTMDFVRPPYKTVAEAIAEEVEEKVTASVTEKVTASVTERVTASVTRAAVIKALNRGKLTIEEIAEDNSVSVDDVLKIQAEMQS